MRQTDEEKVLVRVLYVDSSIAPSDWFSSSVAANSTWCPLNTSPEMIESIMHEHGITTSLLDVLAFFRSRTSGIEEGFCPAFQSAFRDEIYGSEQVDLILENVTLNPSEFSYILKYPERRSGHHGQPTWSIRHTAVYQRIEPSRQRMIVLIANPVPQSPYWCRLVPILKAYHSAVSFDLPCLHVHVELLDCYLVEWRAYMAHYEALVMDTVFNSCWVRYA